MERKTIYFPVLIMTSCHVLREINLVLEYDYNIENGAKINERFYIPAQSVPYIVVSLMKLPDRFDLVYYPLHDFQLILNNIEYEIINNDFPAITCCPKLDCSLYRQSGMEYNIPFDNAPEPSNYEIQVRNSSSGEWVTELGVRSGDNLKFRIVNVQNPSQPISQVFEFSYATNPFPWHFEDLQDDGFEIVLDNYAPFVVVGVYNKDADFSQGIYLVPLPS